MLIYSFVRRFRLSPDGSPPPRQINDGRALQWLYSVASQLVRDVAAEQEEEHAAAGGGDGGGAGVEEATLRARLAAARARVDEAYAVGSPLERYRGRMASDYSDEITRLPDIAPEAPAGGAGGGGALDPALLARVEAAGRVHERNNLDPNTNPLLLFFQSLLPWNAVPGAEGGAAAGGAPPPPPP